MSDKDADTEILASYVFFTQKALDVLDSILEDPRAIEYCRARPAMLKQEIARCDSVLNELDDKELQAIISQSPRARELSDEFYEKTRTLKKLLQGPEALN